MANISIKKDFVDGEKLFAQQLNNNFDTIEKGVNAGNKIIWKDDNGAEIQSFRGTTAEVAERPIIDGQTLYNIETGETALDYGEKRISTGAGNVVYIGDEEPTNDATKIWISNENIEGLGAEIAIGPEEPTTGEEVWFQRGKNLINPLALLYNLDLLGNGTTAPSDSWFITPFIEVNENTSYYMSGFKNNTNKEIQYKEFYDESFNFISQNRDNPAVTPNGVKYVRIAGSLQHKENLLFVQSDVAVDYEPYTPKKIHTKTNEGYEEFYNEEEVNKVNYSTEEQRIGTYLGKPLYRQVVTTTTPKNDTYGLMLDLKSLKVDEMLIFDCKMVGNHSANPIPYYYSNTEYIYIGFGDGGIYGKAVGSATQGKPVRAILEYTKTTD